MDLAAESEPFRQWMWSAQPQTSELRAAADAGELPLASDLWTVVPACAAALWAARAVLERGALRPAVRAGLRLKPVALPFASDKLEAIYVRHKPSLPDINEIKSLSKTLDRPVEELNTWFRVRQRVDRDAVKVRVTADSLWRLIMYAGCVAANAALLQGQPWARDPAACWEGLPLGQRNPPGVKWFFVALQLPLYLVLLVSQLTDRRRAKDMWEMTAHHSLTLALLAFVYLGNFVRIGMLGLLLHDTTDIFIEVSKLANSFRFHVVADLTFAAFAATWAYARLYKFSTVILASVFEYGRAVAGPALNVVAAMLLVLLALNLFWFVKIASMLYRIMWAGTPKEKLDRDLTDLSTDDEVDSDSSFFSDR